MFGIDRRVAYQFTAILHTQIGERLSTQRAVRYLAGIAGQPGFANLLFELVVGIDGRKIERAPGPRVEGRLHRKWIESAHAICKWHNPGTRPRIFVAAVALQGREEVAHALQSAIQFGYGGGVGDPNVFARAKTFAGDGRHVRFAQQPAGYIGS